MGRAASFSPPPLLRRTSSGSIVSHWSEPQVSALLLSPVIEYCLALPSRARVRVRAFACIVPICDAHTPAPLPPPSPSSSSSCVRDSSRSTRLLMCAWCDGIAFFHALFCARHLLRILAYAESDPQGRTLVHFVPTHRALYDVKGVRHLNPHFCLCQWEARHIEGLQC